MKRKLLHFILVTLAIAIASWLPLDVRKTAENGTASPGTKIELVKALATPQQAMLGALEPVNVPPVAAIAPKTAPAAPVGVYGGSGDANLDWIIQHESSGNQYAVNEIGACGLFQALPCSKMGCSLSDIQCQLEWGRQYAISRYGSTYAAMLFWQSNRWW